MVFTPWIKATVKDLSREKTGKLGADGRRDPGNFENAIALSVLSEVL
jgi:hypothetical protein